MPDAHNKRKHREDRAMEYLGTFYSRASERFQKGMMKISRTIKAEQDDLCVVEIEGGRLG